MLPNNRLEKSEMYNLYWGDLHSHCSISYGHGTVEQALMRAKQQLDFCSVTGHAFWPDMPTDRAVYAEIIDYHNEGFATLARNWDRLIELQRTGTKDDDFIAFPSYEWHSLKYGDHNVYTATPELPLRDAPDLPALRKVASEAQGITIPHHIGYRAGYRGINWDEYRRRLTVRRNFFVARLLVVRRLAVPDAPRHGAARLEQHCRSWL